MTFKPGNIRCFADWSIRDYSFLDLLQEVQLDKPPSKTPSLEVIFIFNFTRFNYFFSCFSVQSFATVDNILNPQRQVETLDPPPSPSLPSSPQHAGGVFDRKNSVTAMFNVSNLSLL